MSGQILVGDGNQSLLNLLQDNLTAAGFNVITVTTAEEAIEACETATVDLALVDVQIATIFGRTIRSHTVPKFSDAKVPFVVLSEAEEEEEQVQAAMNAGALSALPKSVIEALACTQCLGPLVRTVVAQSTQLRCLRRKLATSSETGQTIDIATGILMERYHLNAKTAFARLREVCRRNRRKIADVSAEILHSQELAAELSTEPRAAAK